jgi:hypothetical protein
MRLHSGVLFCGLDTKSEGRRAPCESEQVQCVCWHVFGAFRDPQTRGSIQVTLIWADKIIQEGLGFIGKAIFLSSCVRGAGATPTPTPLPLIHSIPFVLLDLLIWCWLGASCTTKQKSSACLLMGLRLLSHGIDVAPRADYLDRISSDIWVSNILHVCHLAFAVHSAAM